MDHVLAGLRAAAEPTRLRLLALCAEHELTVSELTTILGQSQPSISRHLKLLCEGGLLERFREGTSVFYRIQRASDLPERLVALIPANDPARLRDGARLADIQDERARRVAAYFETNAHRWDELRGLYVSEGEVETQLSRLILGEPAGPIGEMLDVGTGTGRMLEIFGPHVERGCGIDLSREMLSVARVNLERAGLRHCDVRQADMYNMSFSCEGRFDLVILHQVLHFAERPGDVLVEAARVLRPGGRIVIVDFAPHELEFLREAHAHRRLGFGEAEAWEWGKQTGLSFQPSSRLPSDQLTVVIWTATKPAQEFALETGAARASVSGKAVFMYGESSS